MFAAVDRRSRIHRRPRGSCRDARGTSSTARKVSWFPSWRRGCRILGEVFEWMMASVEVEPCRRRLVLVGDLMPFCGGLRCAPRPGRARRTRGAS